MGDHVHMMLSIPPKYSYPGGGVHQGEELCWVEFLGEGLLRVDGGAERRRCEIKSESKRKKIRRLDQLKMFE